MTSSQSGYGRASDNIIGYGGKKKTHVLRNLEKGKTIKEKKFILVKFLF